MAGTHRGGGGEALRADNHKPIISKQPKQQRENGGVPLYGPVPISAAAAVSMRRYARSRRGKPRESEARGW